MNSISSCSISTYFDLPLHFIDWKVSYSATLIREINLPSHYRGVENIELETVVKKCCFSA